MKSYKIYLYKKDARRKLKSEEHIETVFIENTEMTIESLKTNLIRPLLIATGSKVAAKIWETPIITGKRREFDEFGNPLETYVDEVE